jgi:hypothetical protein
MYAHTHEDISIKMRIYKLREEERKRKKERGKERKKN